MIIVPVPAGKFFYDKSLTSVFLHALSSGVKILITAFRPFGGRKNNTSEDILTFLQEHGIKGRDFWTYYAVLPVNFSTAWPALCKAIGAVRPDALLLLGEKTGQQPAIETTAQNRRRHKRGNLQIEKSGPPKLRTIFDAHALATATRTKSASAKHRWIISHNAGDYLCNFIYWKALAHEPQLPSAFVHVPAMPAVNSEREIACIARQTKTLISAMQKQLRNGINTQSAQKQLTVPGQKAGRAKRKKES